MNRLEYMMRLAELLQDVSEEERVAAMQYYNDYFNDAGEENEQKVIEELGSPEKVAAEMKAGLGREEGEFGEFRDTGYTDVRFEEKNSPTTYEKQGTHQEYGCHNDGEQAVEEKKPWTNKWLKIALIILVILVALPVGGPILGGIAAAVIGLSIAAFAVFFAFVVASVAVFVSGLVLLIVGFFTIVSNVASALLMIGSGLLFMALGAIATVASIRLCIIVVPGLFRFFVGLIRRIFHKREAVAS